MSVNLNLNLFDDLDTPDVKDQVVSNPTVTRRCKTRSRDMQYTMEEELFESVPQYAPSNWAPSEESVEQLRAAMITRHLTLILDERTDQVTVLDIVEWMMSDDIHPFSFRVCVGACIRADTYLGELFSLSDISEFRNMCLFQVRSARKSIDLTRFYKE
jgi:hypothetical protein